MPRYMRRMYSDLTNGLPFMKMHGLGNDFVVPTSTDNSIYQQLPQGVIFPKSEKDIQVALQIASQDQGSRRPESCLVPDRSFPGR